LSMGKIKLQMLKPRIGLLAPRVSSQLGREIRRTYDTRVWRDVIRPAKLAADPLCQRCKYLGTGTEAEHVDHRIPLRQGGAPFDWDNLVSLCRACHSTKTMCEQAGEPFPEIALSAPQPYAKGVFDPPTGRG
jgi:hypothetical protein